MDYWDDIVKDIINEFEIYIYGAGLMGKALLECLVDPPYSKHISGFIVGDTESNPDEIRGIPVRLVSDKNIDRSALILVALHEKNLPSAIGVLEAEKYMNYRIVSFDSDSWNHIRGNWIRANSLIKNHHLWANDLRNSKIRVYVAHSAVDKKIDDYIPYSDFEIPIQVGKKLTDKRVCNVCDDESDNISDKNKQYCELTALYWIWKHCKADYLGLSHYRRRFLEADIRYNDLVRSNIDMVVTIPILNLSGVGTQYGLDHSEKDWNTFMDVIKELTPDYYDSAKKAESGTYYYGYNMFIARYDIFCSYCKWLFEILGECEKRIGIKTDSYQNRYIGNLAERMLGMYIDRHDLKIMITDKTFISGTNDYAFQRR